MVSRAWFGYSRGLRNSRELRIGIPGSEDRNISHEWNDGKKDGRAPSFSAMLHGSH